MQIAALYRHPIKSHGREAISNVTLTEGGTMPWDRVWAVTHEATKFDSEAPEWVSCRNFVIGSRTPAVAGIWAQLDEDRAQIKLTHQDLSPLTICPDSAADIARFLDWVAPLCAETRDAPKSIIRVEGRGMTDRPYPSVSIMNSASHDAVAGAMGTPLTCERWRGNIWLENVAAWAEFGWIGRDIRIGTAVLRVREPIKRCSVTNTNPVTGRRDTETLDVLNTHFGHQDFGVYAEVITTGDIALGDTAEVL